MARLQLALTVRDIGASIKFYSEMLGTPPHKIRPAYANFVVDNPPLKLVLIESKEGPLGLNHLGVETADSTEVDANAQRLGDLGVALQHEQDVECCFARQHKFWITDPDSNSWEYYNILDDYTNATNPDTAECCNLTKGGSLA